MFNATIVGNLCRDAEQQTINYANGNSGSVARFAIAAYTGKDKNGENQSMFIDCSLFGGLVQYMLQYGKKGSTWVLNGDISQQQYQGQDGALHTKLSCKVNNCQCIKQVQQQVSTQQAQPNYYQQPNQQTYNQQVANNQNRFNNQANVNTQVNDNDIMIQDSDLPF